MQFMLFICSDPNAPTYVPEEDNIEEWGSTNDANGVTVAGDRLRPVTEAKTVVVRDGQIHVTDGPFAETTEWIAGYDILECESLDHAIARAAAHPMARFGRVEVRAVWPFE